MRGVCVDIGNQPPSAAALLKLGATGVRLEIKDHPDFVPYTNSLYFAGIELAYLYGPSTPEQSTVIDILTAAPRPNILILGNEPDVDGESSWTMSPTEYIHFWNNIANARALWILTGRPQLCAAGMLTRTTAYLRSVWNHLDPRPHMVDLHYPETYIELATFFKTFQCPVASFEWCYKTGTRTEVVEWQEMLYRYTAHSCWYCWSENMTPTMGLVSVRQNPTKAYYNYRAALKA